MINTKLHIWIVKFLCLWVHGCLWNAYKIFWVDNCQWKCVGGFFFMRMIIIFITKVLMSQKVMFNIKSLNLQNDLVYFSNLSLVHKQSVILVHFSWRFKHLSYGFVKYPGHLWKRIKYVMIFKHDAQGLVSNQNWCLFFFSLFIFVYFYILKPC